MSVIAGVYYRDARAVSDNQAEAIRKSLMLPEHCDPGVWRSEGVCLAHADLTLRHAATQAQPYVTSRAAIIFDGRLDNRGDLHLLLHDALPPEASDPALALGIYQRNGADGLIHLIGDFSLSIWDAERKHLVLSSDFAGVRPLYYRADGERVMWSTQLMPLVEWGQSDELDEQYVAGFLARSGWPSLTPYRGVRALPPGHCMLVSRESIQVRPFWQPPNRTIIRYTRESEYEERLRELFRDAVHCRLDTDYPVLSELSGGLDSSSIACVASLLIRSGAVNVPRLVTLTYEREGSLDRRFYELVGQWCGFSSVRLSTATHRFIAEDQVGGALPAFWQELHNAAAAVARDAGARTLLTGLSGDMMMHNFADDSSQVAGLIRAGKFGAALKESLAWSHALRIPVFSVLWKGLLSALPAAMVKSKAELYIDSPVDPGDKEDSLTPAFKARTGLSEGYEPFSGDWMKAPPERRKHVRGLLETLELRRLQSPETLTHLYYTHPYSHRPLVEYMLSIPVEIACQPGEPRRLMRRAFKHFWPPELRTRRSKDAFGGVFLNALRPLVPSLANCVEELQLVQRGIVEPANLRRRLDRLVHSLDCNAGQLRRLILLELWLRGSRFAVANQEPSGSSEAFR